MLVFFNVNELWHLFAVIIICTIFFIIMVEFGSFEIAISLASGNLSFSLFFGQIFLGNSLKFRNFLPLIFTDFSGKKLLGLGRA